MGEFQEFLRQTYGVKNDRNYSTEGMIMRISRYGTKMIKGVRKNRPEEVIMNMVLTFSWAGSLANHLHVDLHKEILLRFPDCCPYCVGRPCNCLERATHRQNIVPAAPLRPEDIRGVQDMLRGIYPKNTLSEAVSHTVEEIGEVAEAFQVWSTLHQGKDFDEVVIELVDLFANLFAVASTLGVSMVEEFNRTFPGGCVECHESPCQCLFTKTVFCGPANSAPEKQPPP